MSREDERLVIADQWVVELLVPAEASDDWVGWARLLVARELRQQARHMTGRLRVGGGPTSRVSVT